LKQALFRNELKKNQIKTPTEEKRNTVDDKNDTSVRALSPHLLGLYCL
jgi:hypothetical protein